MSTIAVLRDPQSLPHALAHPVVAIGNFDGLHRGHRAVIDTALATGRRLSRPTAILTFEPHPRDFFQPRSPVFRLTPLPEKTIVAERLGLDALIALSFDAGMAQLTADSFVEEWLVSRLAISGAVIGEDFHFGAKRGGNARTLADAGARLGFDVEIVPTVVAGAENPVSSSAAREALEAGDVAKAAELLAHRWFVTADVLHGEKRGRALGFPTANLRLDGSCRLRHGIYAVRALVEDRMCDGVASYGRRPTFDNGAPLLEVFLFDFAGDLYGQRLSVEFVAWLRGEQKFDGIEPLVAQMREDEREARRILTQGARQDGGPGASMLAGTRPA